MAAPEIRLSIGLDLEFFRGQMRKAVNIAQSEFTAQLAVKIDRNKLNTELNNLQKAIKRRTYRIEIGGNLEETPSKIASLKKALSDLEGTKIDLGIGGITSIGRDEARKIRTALRRSILENGGKILVPTSIIAAITNPDVAAFKAAVKGKLSGINVEVGINTQSATANIAAMATTRQQARSVGQEAAPKNITALQTVENFNRAQLQNTRKAMLGAGMAVGDIKNLTTAKIEDYQKSVVKGLTDSGKEAVNGFALGLKDSSSKISQAAAKIGEAGVRGIKDYLGIASPSKVFELIGKFSVDGLQLGFLEGLKEFKGRSVAEVKAIVALLRMELAKVSDTKPMAGASTGSLRRQLLGSQAYSSPIGPLQQGSKEPWATGRKGQFGYSGYEPRMVSTAYGVRPNPLKQFVAPSASRQIQSQIQSTASQAAPPAKYPWFLNRAPYVPGPMMGPGGSTWSGAGSQRGIAPPVPPLPPGGGGGGGGGGGAGGAGRRGGGIGGLNIPNLPGAGLVQELGTEFAFAAKQVLLFGTAYKALAFLTGFPQQVGDAVGALQTFRNTLNTISPSAGEAAASSQFILDIVDKYNVPLQSARDGFTKLYASMQPAGFSGNEIRDLFLGISQSAATFGMSADKVDRVNYAFAQMASKGQVMSEELKGQLGDVLPGAMAIFAEAAGFKGPEAIKTFSKALEDGAYKGGAMKALLLNVGTIMRKEFGPGAEGAARTFQGSINRMQNSLKLLYESFEPVAIGFLNSVVMPMTTGLKTVTQGVTAYFKGQRAATPEAENFNKILQVLAPSLAGIGKNIAYALQQLLPLVQVVSAVALQVARFLALPLVGYLAGAYLQVMLLTSGFSLLATSGIALATVSMVRFIAQGVVAASVMVGLQRATQQTTVATFLFGQTLQTVMIKSVIGIALVAISALIAKIMELRGQLAAVGGDARRMEDIAKSSAKMGDVEGTKEALGNIKDRLATFKKLQKELKDAKKTSAGGSAFSDRATINTGYEIGSDTARKLIELGVLNEKVLTKTSNGYSLLESQMGIVNSLVNENVAEFEKAGQKGNILTDEAIRKNEQLKKQTGLLPIPPGGEGKKPESLETYYSLQDQLAKAASAADISRIQDEFEERFRLANSYYDLQEARANSFQKITINFQKELLAIEQRRQKAMLDAELEVRKARESVASEAAVGDGTGPTSMSPRSGLGSTSPARGSSFQGFPVTSLPGESRAYRNGTHEGYDFGTPIGTALSYAIGGVVKSINKVGRGNAGKTIEVMLDNGVIGMSMHLSEVMMEAGQRFEANQIIAKTGDTGAGPAHLHQESAPHAYRTGQAGASLAYLNIGKGRAAAGAGAPGKILGSERRQTLATQQTGFALNDQRVVNLRAEKRATEETAIAIENYVAAIAPVAEQQLQNSILEKRVSLMKSGMSGNLLDTEIQIFEQQEKQKIGISALTGMMEENNKKVKDGKMFKQDAIDRNKELLDTINKLNIAVPLSTKLTKENAMAQADSAFTERVNALKEEIRLLLISNDAERRLAELRKDYNGDEMQAQKLFDLEKIKKNIEETRALIGDFVSSTTGDYKGFLKAVISGEDAADALKQFQDGLKDKVLTIFLDFAMAPVEKFLKEGLEGLLLPKAVKQKAGELPKEIAKDPVDATNNNTNATNANTTSLNNVAAALAGTSSPTGGVGPSPEEKTKNELDKMAKDTGNAANEAKDNGEKFKESLGKVTAGIGIAAGTIMGIMAGMSQIKKGGTGNTLMGIGSILASVGGGIGGFMKLKGANGGTAAGGWKPFPARAFANGGMVKGPTLGLVGEGKYNEAIVPLPDGRSIPVQMRGGPGGGGSSRDLLASQSQSRSSPSVLSMSFQSTTINGVEYVDRAQLEMAMAETRRVASRDGAARGANLAIDRLANSPSSRRRAGIR